MAIDTKLLEDDAKMNALFPGKPGGPLKRRMSQEAFQRIVDAEGPEVLTPAAEGYWRDQDARFPHLSARASGERRVFNGFGNGRRGDANPRRMRLVEGVWMERVHGKWVRRSDGKTVSKQLWTAIMEVPWSTTTATVIAQYQGTREELKTALLADDPIWSKHPVRYELHDEFPSNEFVNKLAIRHIPKGYSFDEYMRKAVPL